MENSTLRDFIEPFTALFVIINYGHLSTPTVQKLLKALTKFHVDQYDLEMLKKRISNFPHWYGFKFFSNKHLFETINHLLQQEHLIYFECEHTKCILCGESLILNKSTNSAE